MSAPDTFDGYPGWARTLAHGIRARLGNTFLLHGNTHDVVAVPKAGASATLSDFVPLTTFLADWIFGQREVVIEYQRANGAVFHTRESHKHFTDAVAVVDAVHGTDFAQSLPRDPSVFFSLLDSFLKQVVNRKEPLGVAIIFPYVETLIPESAGESSPEDRAVRVFLQKWATDPALLASNVTLVLVTENLADISSRIVRSPQTVEIQVDRPDEGERLQFLQAVRDAGWFAKRSDVPPARLAQLTSGLTRIQLRQILSSVDEHDARLDAASLRNQKKAVIEAECFGLLEYVETRFSLEMVSGHEGVKQRLRRAAQAIAAGRLRGVPMGYLIAGPVGSAKTFLVNCFTGEIGFPCVKFLNVRSQWQGVTEGNLEKILKLLQAMWPVGVIIDEADAFLGDRNQQGDSGTSNRVFAQFVSFMGNTEYRGKILWFLITSRPDLLPVDVKRQGRAEEHLALFYPETDEEYEALFRIMLKKSGLKTPVQSIKEVLDKPHGLSGADIEAILARAVLATDAGPGSGDGGDEAVSAETLRHAFTDFIPATSPLERELQILVAVQECTSREVLPERYRSMERETVLARINELRALLNS
jgi:SpoVK/Ycf46/Vps4 family AAA+-type ATPase